MRRWILSATLFGGIDVYVLHDLAQIDIDAAAEGIAVVVSGHSHQPRIEHRHGVLFVNPGSAGPRRFRLPISVGQLLIRGSNIKAELRELVIE